MTDRSDQVVYLNNCELFIESMTFPRRGGYYLVWKKGKKNIQSNIYQSKGQDPIFPKELLSLSLKVYYQGGMPQPRHTHLILFSAEGEQIQRTKLMVHEWSMDFTENAVQLGGGTIKLRVKRKSVMKLQKFHRMKNEVEQTSEDQSARFLKKISMKKGNSQKEQLIRLTKEVEDLNYLVDKLKEERNNGLSKIQKLEAELSQINTKVCRDINKIKDYYTKKIELRESIYKEELQQLVTSFNSNYEYNKQILTGLVNDKYDYEEQIRQLKESNQEFITRQSQNFQNLIGQMQRHKQAVDEELKDSNEKLNQRQNTIVQLNQQISKLNEELQQAKQQFKKLQNDKEESQLQYTGQINDMNIKINELESLNNELNLSVQRLNTENRFKDEEITSYNNMITQHVREKNQMHTDNMQLIDQREELITKNQILNMNNEQLKVEVRQLQGELAKVQMENEQISRQYNIDLDKMNQSFKKEIEAEREINFELMNTRDTLEHEKQMLSIEVADKNAMLQQKNNDLDIYIKELEQNKIYATQLTKQLDDTMTKLREQHRQMSDQLTNFMQKANFLENQNTQLHAEIRQLTVSNQQEIMKIKDQYDALMMSNKQLLEEEIDLLQKTKQEEEKVAMDMKNQYEQQITNIMDQHRTELDEIQRIFKDDLDKKEAEVYKVMQEKLTLEQEFEAYKYRIKMEEDQRQLEEYQNQERGLKKKSKVSPSIQQIQQIEEIDSDDENFIPLKKKKTLAKKKALLFEEQDQSEDEDEQEQEGQSQAEINFEDDEEQEDSRGSVLGMMNKKKGEKKQGSPKKGKLKVKKLKILDKSEEKIGQSLEFSKDLNQREEEEEEQPKPSHKQKPKLLSKKTISGIDINKLLEQKTQLEDKILDLEAQIQQLKFNQQTLKSRQEREIRRHLNRITVLEGQVFDLNRETQELLFKLKQQDSEYADKFKKQAERKKKEFELQEKKRIKEAEQQEKKMQQQQEEHRSQRSQASIRSIVLRKDSKHESSFQKQSKQDRSNKHVKYAEQPPSPKSIASKKSKKSMQKEQIPKTPKQYKAKIQSLQQIIIEKQQTIAKIERTNRQLRKDVQNLKDQLQLKAEMQESKVLEKQQKQVPNIPQVSFSGQSFMKQSIANLEDKVSSQKQKYFELKMKYEQKARENQDLEKQISKLKKAYDEIDQKIKRQGIPKSNQQMQSQIDDQNRKILELSRNVNQARLERDSLEDEVRIIRKKLTELSKTNQSNEARASQTQRQVDDLRRRQQRYKREIEEYQEDIKRVKQVNRKTLEEISQVRKSQSQYIIERKKVLDEVVRLEGVVAQKQTELVKANKEAQKLRSRMNQNMEGKQGRQREYRTEMQRLQIERSRVQRKNREHEETIKILNEKIGELEKEMKKNNEERKQTYGQKLKGYIDQVSNISKVVDEYQHQNMNLKHQNAQFFDQNQMLKTSFQKLEIKFEQLSEYSNTLQEELSHCKQQIQQLEKQLKVMQSQQEKNKIVIMSLRKELDNQRVVGRKKTQKAQQLQQINQRFLYDIKNLRLRLNEYQTNSEDKQKLADELFASQRTIGSLEEELHKISQQYQQHTVKYVYTLEDIQAAMKELKEHEEKVKEEEMTKIIYEIDQNSSANRQNMEKQLLSLYNENQKLRVNLHKANEDALEVQLELAQMNHIKERTKVLEKDKNMLERRVRELTDELASAREDIRRLEIKFNQSVRSQENKATQNVILQQKYEQITRRYQELRESHTEMKQDDHKLLEKYKTVSTEKDKTIEKLNNQIQTMHNKLLAKQLQINRLKELQSMNSQDYFKNKKKLECKLDEIGESYRQKQIQLEVSFKSQLRQWKNKHTKIEEDLNQRIRRIEELEEGVFMLQNEVQELTAQLTSARTQLAEQSEIYTIQVNRIRNQMREMQQTYDNNLRNLEEQLSSMSKQLTTLKYARQNVSAANNSRLRISRQSDTGDDRSMRRFEEKIKLKDKRIQELKETIVAYEEKLMEYAGKKDKSQEVQYWKGRLSQGEAEWKLLLDKKSKELAEVVDAYRKLKQQHIKCTTRQEGLLLSLEEKDLELSSMKSQLSTVTKLYTDLQKQLDKRKQYLNRQIEEQSTLKVQQEKIQKELVFKQQHISQLESKIKDIQNMLRKKTQELKIQVERVDVLEKEKRELLSEEKKKIAGQNTSNMKSKEQQGELETIKTQNRRLRNEASLIVKQNDSLKAELNHKHISIKELLSQVQSNDKIISENQALLSKYIDFNQQSLMKFGVNLEQLLPLAQELQQSLTEKEEELLLLAQEIEEVKFEYDNTFLNYEELKKENYELTLNNQQKETYQLRIQQAEDQLLLLQNQKQDLQFRLNSMYIQLQSIKDSLSRQRDVDVEDMKNKLEQIVTQQYR